VERTAGEIVLFRRLKVEGRRLKIEGENPELRGKNPSAFYLLPSNWKSGGRYWI
jgi:hypothetical protein